MRASRLVQRGLRYYWRSHLAVLLGVATAVAVLAGALLVGDSVRGSLAGLVQSRLGRTDRVLVSTGFFRDALASEIATDDAFRRVYAAAAPLVVTPGAVTAQESGRRVGAVRVYGVDDRFWTFHGVARVGGPPDRQAFVSRALVDELRLGAGEAVLVRVQRPTDMPLESIFGRKDDLGRTLRLDVARVLTDDQLGEFSLEPTQRAVRAVFVPLSRVQQELGVGARVNAVLVASQPGASTDPPAGTDVLVDVVRRHVRLDDLGWRVTPLAAGQGFAVESSGGILDDGQAALARSLAGGGAGRPIFTYLANTLRVGDREIPYSLVTATDLASLGSTGGQAAAGAPSGSTGPAPPPIVLNDWAARELGARPGDALTMEYFAWEEPGTLATRATAFRVAGIVPVTAGDRQMAPAYPGISDAPTLDEWDPPFPVDLRRIRPADEAYWTAYRTTPKAFVPLEAGQGLWRSRYGALTSIRVTTSPAESASAAADAFAARLIQASDPFALGLAVRDVRAEGAAASQGATDFGEYFVYFSTFLVVSALLLAALFFKLGIEQRVREVGLLRAVGFRPAAVRRAFFGEAVIVAAAGSALGALGAVAYAWLVITALGTWWVDAVGTTALRLHVQPATVAAGAGAGLLTAAVCLWWTLRVLSRVSERALLAGEMAVALGAGGRQGSGRRRPWMVAGLGLGAVVLVVLGAAGWMAPEGAFFGAGTLLLAASVGAARAWLSRTTRRADGLTGTYPVARLGFRGAAYRPARSVVAMAVVGAATFLLVSVDAFRRGAPGDTGRTSGVGGYGVLVETLLPVVHDLNGAEGRYALNLTALDPGVRFEPFRLRPGDDASCLNLYRPTNPRIVAPRDAFLDEGRFAFQASLAETPEDRANPWRLLRREEPDGAIPVVADANSMAYVLHRGLGETFTIQVAGRDVALRFVGALRDSIFQGELVMGEDAFARLFPEIEGARLFLVETPAGNAATVAGALQEGWVDLGADATPTAVRLAEFHRVENTYLSTFQTLGGLGLLLGTVGLGTVLLRNVLERRKELALLAAVGFRASHLRRLVLTENAALLAGGLAAGVLAAAVAVAPAVAARGGGWPLTPRMAGLLVAVFATGLLSSVVAISAASRTPTLPALRSE